MKQLSGEYHQVGKRIERASVSSVFSNSIFLLLLGDAAPLMPFPQNSPLPPETPFAVAPPLDAPKLLIKPAFSFSTSFHPRIVPSNPSISNLLGSARGVDKKESKTLVTSRQSTLVSEDDFRRRRRASIRCSFMITTVAAKLNRATQKIEETDLRAVVCQ